MPNNHYESSTSWELHHGSRARKSLVVIHIDIFVTAGELYFITDRKSGFWNLHKWVT